MDRDKVICEANNAIKSEDFDLAWRLLLPIAELGDAEAQYRLGLMRYEGASIPEEIADSWLEKAAKQKHPDALFFWASRNHPDEPLYLIQAGELGSTRAQYFLGARYATGESPFPKDETEAIKWYTMAANAGDSEAQYNLGSMILYGEGARADINQARYWLEKSSAQGNLSAKNLLAEITQK